MQIKQSSLLDILKTPNTQFVVPIYQRVYSWGEMQCRTLWDDVMRAARAGTDQFCGVMLFAIDAENWGETGRLCLVDGQQRITTVTLMLIGLAEHLRKTEGEVCGLDAGQIEACYLKTGAEDKLCKLALSHLDCGTLATLADGQMPGGEYSKRLVENLEVFRGLMKQEGFDAEALWHGLSSLQVIAALLTGEDRPQLVFESLNSKGAPLSAGDMMRNMFLNAASEVERRELYEGRWKRLEELIDAADGADTDDAIVSWLAHKFRETNVHGQIEAYAALRDYAMQENVSSAELLDELLRFAERWSEDRGFREKADKAAREWLQNRPRATVSELRMFGD